MEEVLTTTEVCGAGGLCDEGFNVEATGDVIVSDDVSLRDGETDVMVAGISDGVTGVGGNVEDVIRLKLFSTIATESS